MKTIKFTIIDEEYKVLHHQAKSRGLTASGFSKMAIWAYINKYPTKGVFAEMDKLYHN